MADYSDYKECADCVHYELCLHQEKFLIEHNRKDLIRRYGFGLSEPEICCNFRDHSRFVELPCKVGDTVYFIKGGRAMSDTVIRFVIDRYAVKLTKSNGADIGYTTQFGERIFLTREEAEQALKLKGRENNG